MRDGTPTWRATAAVAIGVVYGLLSWAQLRHVGDWIQANDFTYAWFGARELLAGRDPYVTIKAASVPWGPYLFYPVPAFILAMPVAWLPAQIAGPTFVAVSAAFLAAFLTPRWRLLALISAPMLIATQVCQWSPLLTAAALWIPAIAVVAAKPTFVLPLAALQRSPAFVIPALVGGCFLLIISFLFLPGWIPEWLDASRLAARAGGYHIPILKPFGLPLILAALRWRTPEGRLLLAMAVMPQKMLFYDQLLLMLIPKNRREMMFLVAASLIALAFSQQFSWTTRAANDRLVPFVLFGCHLPALLLVLRRPTAEPRARSGATAPC
jgi:hypothetical protein